MSEQQNISFTIKDGEQYITLLQENIMRMANNSANCKNWLVVIIAGALAVSFSKENATYLPHILTLLIAITYLFFFLDCLYLGIERRMKNAEKAFVKACKGEGDAGILFMTFSDKPCEDDDRKFVGWIKNKWKQLWDAICALDSWSTTPFYATILVILYMIKYSLIPSCGC